MKDSELLENRVRDLKSRISRSQKEKYRLAKELGFSAVEAAVLQNWKEGRIRALAESKAKGF
jgi:hypothetical protein